MKKRGRKRKYDFSQMPIGEIKYLESNTTVSVLNCAKRQVPQYRFKCWKIDWQRIAILRLA